MYYAGIEWCSISVSWVLMVDCVVHIFYILTVLATLERQVLKSQRGIASWLNKVLLGRVFSCDWWRR